MVDKWADDVAIKLQELSKIDQDYQELLLECKHAGQAYKCILEKLTQEEQEMLDTYIALCEDLQYRFAQLAYYYGVGEGKASIYKGH